MKADTGSPWLTQFERTRLAEELRGDESADVVIVGGGLAGVSTAYQVLRETDLGVTMLEMDLVGHGATGHNAGQAVVAFERTFAEMGSELGYELVGQGYQEVQEAKRLLREMVRDSGVQVPIDEVTGRVGLTSVDAIRQWAREKELRAKFAVPMGDILVADETYGLLEPRPCYHRVPKQEVLDLLGTDDEGYVAVAEAQLQLLNTSMLCEFLVMALLDGYADRFRVYEHSRVTRIRLGDEAAIAVNGHTVFGGTVVLCTNGYGGISFEACDVPVVQGRVRGRVGFMNGYLTETAVPAARAFFRDREEEYYYLTRRAFGPGGLTSVGGPEAWLERGERYDARKHYRPGAFDDIDRFVAGTLRGEKRKRDLEWTGLMGYTEDRVRLIGRDPRNRALMYNLGCNGIGILQSVAGARRIAGLLGGRQMPPSMFDPGRLEKRAQAVLEAPPGFNV